jgi:hypothetical protein
MTNQVIKKITIPRSQITSVSPDGKYYLRYRVVSAGNSRTSHWSQVFVLDGGSLTNNLNTVTQVVSASAVSASWNIINTLNVIEYDVYVAYGTGSGLTGFEYYATTAVNNIYIPKPVTVPAKTQMRIAIFARGSSKLDNTILKNATYLSTLVGSSTTFLAETGTFAI